MVIISEKNTMFFFFIKISKLPLKQNIQTLWEKNPLNTLLMEWYLLRPNLITIYEKEFFYITKC